MRLHVRGRAYRLLFLLSLLFRLHVRDRGMQQLAADFGKAIDVRNHDHRDANFGIVGWFYRRYLSLSLLERRA